MLETTEFLAISGAIIITAIVTGLTVVAFIRRVGLQRWNARRRDRGVTRKPIDGPFRDNDTM